MLSGEKCPRFSYSYTGSRGVFQHGCNDIELEPAQPGTTGNRTEDPGLSAGQDNS